MSESPAASPMGLEAPSSRMTRIRAVTGLAPVRRRGVWIASGMFLQLVAIAMPVAAIAARAKDEADSSVAFRVTLLMVTRELFRTPTGIALLAGSVVLFAAGSVVLARPFVRSLPMLLGAVPLAAVVGVLVLGALALVVALIALVASVGFDGWSGPSGSGRTKKGKKQEQQA